MGIKLTPVKYSPSLNIFHDVLKIKYNNIQI